MRNLLSLIFILALCSCEDQFLVKLPRPETQQLTNVFCVIGPNETTIACIVNESNPIYGEPVADIFDKEFRAVPDAEVTIKGPNGSVQLFFRTIDEIYFANVDPNFLKEGNSYALTVKLANSEILISETTIPITNISNVSIKLDSIIENDGWWTYKTLLPELNFKDKAGSGDIYRIKGRYSKDTTNGYYTEIRFNSRYSFILDEAKDGEILREIGSSNYEQSGDYFKFDINISSVTKSYYLYHLSLNSYSEYSDENPFVEPSINYSNIEGGLGLFAGRVSKNFEFVLN